MRKRLLSSVLVVVLTFCMVSTTAFAWDETGMTARFNYTKETEVSEPPSDSNIPKYEVLIPAPTSLNQTDRLNIALAYNGLGEGETVVVSVNRTTFGEDGYFHLTSDTGGDLKAVLDRYGSSMPESERIDAEEGPFIVAVFDNCSKTANRPWLFQGRSLSADVFIFKILEDLPFNARFLASLHVVNGAS